MRLASPSYSTAVGGRSIASSTAHRLFISTGCSSADVLAAPLLTELFKRGAIKEATAVGGEPLRDAGAKPLSDSTPWSTIGTAHGIRMFIRSGWNVLRTLRQIDREFQTHPPDLAILVDNAGINFRILSMARKHGIPVLYYVPPEFWSVWSVEWRGVLRAKPTIAAIFPSQADSYRRLGLETQWIGHPIIDLTDRLPTAPRRVSTNPVISIFPGSRRQEVRQLLDPMLEAAQLIHEKERSARFVVCAANPMTREMILPKLKQWNLPIECRYRQTHSVLSESHLALACSGTVTLEAALLGVPMVAMYRLGSMMDNIVQQVFLPRSKHPFFALPNVLLNRPVVPELVNQDVQGRIIADRAAPLLRDPSRRNSVLADLARIRPLLGNAGAINRAADLAEQMLTAAQRTKTSAPTRAA